MHVMLEGPQKILGTGSDREYGSPETGPDIQILLHDHPFALVFVQIWRRFWGAVRREEPRREVTWLDRDLGD